MNILHVTPAFYPATYFGGPIFSTLGLCDALAQRDDVHLRVLTTDTAGPARQDRVAHASFPVKFPAGYEVYYCRKLLGRDISFEMFRHLLAMVRWADVVHLTGVYSPPTVPTLLACGLLGRPLVWSPRGSLQRWDGSSRKGMKWTWEAVCNRLLRPGRAALHVTSQEEAEASAARMPHARIALIPNGVDLPISAVDRIWRPGGKLRMLFMGRLHPIKGIENLLAAMVEHGAGDMSLIVCGDGDPAYRALLQERVKALGLADRVSFAGEVKGEAKLAAFAAADVCVVPSFTENFGMVVAESLAHGVPVVVSRGAPWSAVEARGCGLWVENTPAQLAKALREIQSRDLAGMGEKGRQWMKDDFSWERVAVSMLEIYRNLITEAAK